MLKAQGKTQADLAKHVKRSRPWISQILSGRRATTLSTLEQITGFFQCDVADLFAKERVLTSPTDVPYPVQATGVKSASTLSEGASHGAETSSLEQQLIDLQTEYDQFATEVGGAVQYFGSLVADKDKKAAARQALARKNDRKHDRQLPRKRR